MLKFPAIKFLSAVREKDIQSKIPSIYCSPKDNLKDLIKKMTASRIHRIYVCNDDHTPSKW